MSGVRSRMAAAIAVVTTAGALAVVTPGTASAGSWTIAGYWSTEADCAAAKVEDVNSGFVTLPAGNTCYTGGLGYYYKFM
jgi:hypothetical protein